MANVTHRNACNLVSEKSLADSGAEGWQFYDYESSLKLNTQSELSKKASQLRKLMQEKNARAIAKRLDAEMKRKREAKREQQHNDMMRQ